MVLGVWQRTRTKTTPDRRAVMAPSRLRKEKKLFKSHSQAFGGKVDNFREQNGKKTQLVLIKKNVNATLRHTVENLLCKQSTLKSLYSNHRQIITIFYISKMRGRILLVVGLGSSKMFFLILGRESMRWLWQGFVQAGLG
jgi:hypothetical protein